VGQAPAIVAAMRDRHGIQIAGGQGELKPDVFRIGHLGYIDALDLLGTLAALETVLGDLGHPHEPGAGLTAARAALNSHVGDAS
ncbi:MAG: alanine--glyoxylate aminotransferase family protein, partial [Acidobacteriota bacterium]